MVAQGTFHPPSGLRRSASGIGGSSTILKWMEEQEKKYPWTSRPPMTIGNRRGAGDLAPH